MCKTICGAVSELRGGFERRRASAIASYVISRSTLSFSFLPLPSQSPRATSFFIDSAVAPLVRYRVFPDAASPRLRVLSAMHEAADTRQTE